MIRINTAPLGMQNLLSVNRKLHISVDIPCYNGFNNGDKRLILANEENGFGFNNPMDVPAVIYNSDFNEVHYYQNGINIKYVNKNISGLTHYVSVKEGCNNGNPYNKVYEINGGETITFDKLPNGLDCFLYANSKQMGLSPLDTYILVNIYNDDNDELLFSNSVKGENDVELISELTYNDRIDGSMLNLRIEAEIKTFSR